MYPHIEETLAIEQNQEDSHTFTSVFKEFGFLALILFLGFTGFSLCLDKIYRTPDTHKIEEITVHQPILSEAEYNHFAIEE